MTLAVATIDDNEVIYSRAERDPVKRREMVRQYIDGGYELRGDVVPSIAGAGVMLKSTKSQMSDWAKNDHELSVLFDELRHLQEQCLINGALSGKFNQSIVKLILATHHGYSDRIDTTNVTITADISDPEAARRIAYAMASLSPPPISLANTTTHVIPTKLFADPDK